MKYLIIIVCIFFFYFPNQEDKKMLGKYKMEYDQDYRGQNGVIVLDGNSYERKLSDGKLVKGNIDYQKYFILLNDKKSNLQVIFPKREMENDTIFFRTKDLTDKSAEDVLTVYGGKLIRLK